MDTSDIFPELRHVSYMYLVGQYYNHVYDVTLTTLIFSETHHFTS